MDGEVEGASRTKRRLVVAAVLLVVAAIAVEVITNAVKTHRDIHASYVGITKVDARVSSGTLRLIANNGNSVEVDRKENYTLRGPSITERVENGTLLISENCAGLHVGECTTSYVISVPASVATDAMTTAGLVTADGLRGSLNVNTDGGKADISHTFGDLSVTTRTGKIACDDISSTTVVGNSKSGDIALDFGVDPMNVTAHSNDGNVVITVPKSNTSYNVSAISANKRSTVNVKVDVTSPRQITARSENGDVSVDRG
jgi:DUF4097 and DUF4098 domain-containing protein YvlB